METLQTWGWQINTAFVERHNLTIRQLVAGLGRRTNTLVQSPARLEQQVVLAQTYYNFCLSSRALTDASTTRTPAMTIGCTDRTWSLREILWFKPPPFQQSV